MKNVFGTFVALLMLSSFLTAQKNNSEKELLIRCDDIGVCHSVNLAAEKLAKAKIPFSASILFVCPWYQEAVQILKDQPQVSVGVHLAINAEWKNYKWGPVLGRSAVPSLVDAEGYFFPTAEACYANNPKTEEVEKELRAQIERAINSGLVITYVDFHMGTIYNKPEFRSIVMKLADEYHLAVSEFMGEKFVQDMYWTPVEKKTTELCKTLSTELSADSVNFLMCHIAVDDAEGKAAMVDTDPTALQEVSKHRQAELNALLSPEFSKTVKANNIKLVNYSDLISRKKSTAKSAEME